MPNIIIKNYDHINSAFPNWDTPKGVHVKNKDHYDRLMKENNFISHEEACKNSKSNNAKEYKVSDTGKSIIQAAKATKDKKGRVKLSDRTIDAMIKQGSIKKEYAQGFSI